jgi:hypothetical protein
VAEFIIPLKIAIILKSMQVPASVKSQYFAIGWHI